VVVKERYSGEVELARCTNNLEGNFVTNNLEGVRGHEDSTKAQFAKSATSHIGLKQVALVYVGEREYKQLGHKPAYSLTLKISKR
jgi:hypothetical protein